MRKPFQIDFLKFQDQLVFKKIAGIWKIYDPIRKNFFVREPEEVVRQLVLLYLINEKGYNKNKIAVEKMLKVNRLPKRFDILTYDNDMEPFLMVECKARTIPVSEETLWQIGIYNWRPFRVKYLFVTNGLKCYCCRMDYQQQSFEFIDEVPSFAEVGSQ